MLALVSALPLSSKEDGEPKTNNSDAPITLDFQIYYKVDSIEINPNYLDNPKQIHEIIHYLNNSPKIDSITIYAWSSPEGGYAYNKRLSQGRAKAAKDFLLKHSPDSLKLNSSMIKISPLAENWEGLIEIVEKEYFRADRAKVLKTLYNKQIGDETRKWRLQQLDKGRTWTYLVRKYMPRLRTAKWTCVWAETLIPVPELPIPSDGLTVVPKGSIAKSTIITNKDGHVIPFNIKPADTTKLTNDNALLKDYLNNLHEDKWENVWPTQQPIPAIVAKKDSLIVDQKGSVIDNRSAGEADITSPHEVAPADSSSLSNTNALVDNYLSQIDKDKWERIWPAAKEPVPSIDAQKDSLAVVHKGDIIDNRSAGETDITAPYHAAHADTCVIINEHTLIDNYLTKLDEDKWERIWPTAKAPVPALDAQKDSLAIVHKGDIIDNRSQGESTLASPFEISSTDTSDISNYDMLMENYLTKLQEDKWIRIWPDPKAPVKSIASVEDTLYAESKAAIIPPVVVADPRSQKKPFYISARTNMLYDLALIPNIGLDIYLGKNFSLSGNWMYAWWKNDNIYWYWRTYGGDLGVRYWFGKAAKAKPLTGHHVGLYGQIITYDFELGGRGYLGDRWTYGGGIEYGYSLPIARRLNIDFNLGFGYLGGEFKEYLPIDGHYVWQATKRRQFIGPTKAEISLVWQIGRGNINAGKGGKK